MKDGYLQIKIRELDYKLKQQMQLAENLEKQLQMVIDTKKEYKSLFNKLKKIDSFKEDVLKEIKKVNKIEIESILAQTKEAISKQIKKEISRSFEQLEKNIDIKLNNLKSEQVGQEFILKNSKEILYNKELCILLMEELVKERIFLQERIDILKKRASIRTSEK